MAWWKPFSKKAQRTAELQAEAPKLTPRHQLPNVKLPNERSFNAADTGRLNNSWGTMPVSADQLIFNQLRTLVARSREQSRNNDYVKKFVGMVVNNVLGHAGVSIQNKTKDRKGQDDPAVQAIIEDALKEWSEAEHCSLDGQTDLRETIELALKTIVKDGEIIIRQHATGDFGYQLELIDPVLLDVAYCSMLRNGNEIRFGIELDQRNRPVAYHLVQPGETLHSYQSDYNSKHYVRIPADQIIHAFIREEVAQKRGIPWASTPLQRMKMLEGYEDATVTNARAGACKSAVWQKTGEGFGAADSDDVPDEEFLEPGTTQVAPVGWTLNKVDWDTPDNYEVFVKQALRGIAAGLGVDYNTLANDMQGVSYNSLRHARLENVEVWKGIQAFIVSKIVQRITKEWFERQYLLGTITFNGKPLFRPLADYQKWQFYPRRWDWVDPLKDINAKKAQIEIGVTSPSEIIRETGRDPATVYKQLAEDKETLAALGLNLFGNVAQPATEEEDDGEAGPNKPEE